jgi:hydrogenase-4 component B
MFSGPLLFAATLALFASMFAGLKAPRLWLGLTISAAVLSFVAALGVLACGGSWELRTIMKLGGEALHLRLDGLSAFFLVLLCVVAAAGAVYSREYWDDAQHPRSARYSRFWWSLMVLSMGAVLLSSNGLHFLIAWELFTIGAYFLITLESQRKEVRAAGWLYLAASHVGTLCLFAFFACLASKTGSWDLGPMREMVGLAPLLWLALAGFSVKAGVFPMHIWLPSAHSNAPSHVSAILSGFAIKLGIYGMLRFTGWLPSPEGLPWIVVAFGVVSAVLGVAFALGQHDLKRLLAYHSVENIGIILIGLGLALLAQTHGADAWGSLALAGALLHVWNHGLFKSLLFLGAGSVLHATGTREMSLLGGLWRRMPWTAAFFALGSAAICGLPPLNGFVSEWLIYLGLFDAVGSHGRVAMAAIPAAVFLAITGALALACFIKACSVVFLGEARSPVAQEAREVGWSMRGPMFALAASCVAIGLFPVLFWRALSSASQAWNPAWGMPAPAALQTLGTLHLALAVLIVLASFWLWHSLSAKGLRRGPTWDCGYAAPTARMQYTAGSFAGIITEWFSWILLPLRHRRDSAEFFPKVIKSESHTPDTVLDRLIHPLSQAVLFASTATRRLQHGKLQSYLAYLLAGLVAMTAFVLLGASK